MIDLGKQYDESSFLPRSGEIGRGLYPTFGSAEVRGEAGYHSQAMDGSCADSDTPRPRRRPRYAGTHPRRYAERYKELDPVAYPLMQSHLREQGRTPAGTHVPIMVPEVMTALDPRAGETVADCTVGYGGHALEFLRRVHPGGRLIGLDVDGPQLKRSIQRIEAAGFRVEGIRSHFAGIAKIMGRLGIEGFDIIFADLGVSSMQIDDPSRGFSYKHDGPLDMRMDDRLPKSAADILSTLSEKQLAAALEELADEPDAAPIAAAIVKRRSDQAIASTRQLVEIIFDAKQLSKRAWRKQAEESKDREEPHLHPAALTFQALRILVNDELNGLKQFFRVILACLRPGGRVGLISFHSGEDRLIKHAFRDGLRNGVYSKTALDPIRPGAEERRSNPRSSSAKFRWAIRTS